MEERAPTQAMFTPDGRVLDVAPKAPRSVRAEQQLDLFGWSGEQAALAAWESAVAEKVKEGSPK